jgi:hypothetical protein
MRHSTAEATQTDLTPGFREIVRRGLRAFAEVLHTEHRATLDAATRAVSPLPQGVVDRTPTSALKGHAKRHRPRLAAHLRTSQSSPDTPGILRHRSAAPGGLAGQASWRGSVSHQSDTAIPFLNPRTEGAGCAPGDFVENRMSEKTIDPSREQSYAHALRISTRLAYRRQEAAAALGLSLRCFDRLVAARELPQPKYAGRIPLWSAAELAAFLKGGRS